MRFVTFILLAAVVPTQAGSYRTDWCVISNGAGSISSASYSTSATIGQPAAGFVKSVSLLHWVGFWSGDVPSPIVVSNPNAAKLLPDGAFVSLAGNVATSAVGDFAGYFYIEKSDRSSGIRVAAPPSAIPGLQRGSVVNVIGTLSTTADHERQISGTIVIITSTTQPLSPLGMSNAFVGGGDLGDPPSGQVGVWRWQAKREGTKLVRRWLPSHEFNNIGLLIRTWGRVTSAGQGYVEIDDGSGPMRVDTSTLASQPSTGSFISVTGISSLHSTGLDHLRKLLPRGNTDILAW